MPGGVVLLIEFLLDESCYILLNVELLQSLSGDVDSILLHVYEERGEKEGVELPSDMSAFLTTAFLSDI